MIITGFWYSVAGGIVGGFTGALIASVFLSCRHKKKIEELKKQAEQEEQSWLLAREG